MWTCLHAHGKHVLAVVGGKLRVNKKWHCIRTYLMTPTRSHVPPAPRQTTQRPSAPSTLNGTQPCLSVCGMWCMWRGCSSWAEPALKHSPTTTVILSSLIGMELLQSARTCMFTSKQGTTRAVVAADSFTTNTQSTKWSVILINVW